MGTVGIQLSHRASVVLPWEPQHPAVPRKRTERKGHSHWRRKDLHSGATIHCKWRQWRLPEAIIERLRGQYWMYKVLLVTTSYYFHRLQWDDASFWTQLILLLFHIDKGTKQTGLCPNIRLGQGEAFIYGRGWNKWTYWPSAIDWGCSWDESCHHLKSFPQKITGLICCL